MVKGGTVYDGRLLTNLIKTDKDVHDTFKQYTQACEVANNALNGWAAADTGDSPDVLTASNRVCELFDEAFEAQRTYLIGLNNYRASLKDVAAREAEIRVIMRDRDIFVSRLVKLNGKKPPTSDSAFEAHSNKLEEARAELAACESTLKSEERALVGVKRRIFREALRMRMRAMAQLADTWRDTAERSIDILDGLEPDMNGSMNDLHLAAQQQAQPPPPTQIHGTPHSQRVSRNFDITSPEGSVIAPSHSASQVAARRAGQGYANQEDGYSDDERGNGNGTIGARGMRRESSATNEDTIEEVDERGGSSDEEGDGRGGGLDPSKYQVHVNKPLSPAEIAAKRHSQAQPSGLVGAQQQQSHNTVSNMVSSGPVQPAPTQQTAPRPAQPNTLTDSGISNGILKKAQATAQPQQQQLQPQQQPPQQSVQPHRETPEERQKRFAALAADSTVEGYNAPAPAFNLPSANTYTIDAYKKKNAPEATLVLPSSNARTRSGRVTGDSSDEDEEADEAAEQYRRAKEASEARDEVRSLEKDRRRTSSFGGFGRLSSSHKRTASDDSVPGRKLQTGRQPAGNRNSQYYQESDAGGSTVRGGSRHEKSKSESHGKSSGGGGGLFGAIGGLFRKRDLNQLGRDRDDDDEGGAYGSKSSGGGWNTSRIDKNVAKANKSPGIGGSTVYVSDKKKPKSSTVSRRRQDDSDSDAPDPRSLVKVVNNPHPGKLLARRTSSNNNLGASVGREMAFSDVGISRSNTVSSRNVNSYAANTAWVPPNERPRAVSDVGALRPSASTGTVVKKKKKVAPVDGGSTVGVGSGLDRKSSMKSTATGVTAASGTGTVKKKKKVVPSTGTAGLAPSSTLAVPPTLSSSRQSSYDASALVNNVARATSGGSALGGNRNSTLISTQNPASRVTRDTPSLMTVVAPSSSLQTNTLAGMHMPSAKNPSLSRSGSVVGAPMLGTLPAPSHAAPASTLSEAPLKKKKTVKRSSTIGDVAGGDRLSAAALSSSATAPSLANAGMSSTVSRPRSILSDGGATPSRRKSVRLAGDTKLSDATYENAGGPASNIAPVRNGILKDSSGSALGMARAPESRQQAEPIGAQEWGTRIGRETEYSSDEEGDEYAKIKLQLNRSERELYSAGFLDKGKGRAAVQ